MKKRKIFYVLSLALLAVVIASAIGQPIATGKEYSEVSREHLLQKDGMYVVEFDILNHEGESQHYTIKVVIDDYRYSEDIVIPDGMGYTYIHDIHSDRITQGIATFAIYKEGEGTPFEEITYHLKSTKPELTQIGSHLQGQNGTE